MFAAAFASSVFAAELPAPEQSGIGHVVVLMMENRSFDHLLGWVPGADGKQAGLSYTDTNGVAHSTWPLAPDFQGCGHPDPDHDYVERRVRRLVAGGPKRRLFNWILSAGGPFVFGSRGHKLDSVRSLFFLDHGGDLSKSRLPARGAD
jgi:hypothetical protein